MHVTQARIFSETAHWPILRRILLYCLEEHHSLSTTCRNVRHILLTDPDLRDRTFQLMYSLPPSPPSLDGPLPSRPNDPRTPHDTENFLREQALQTFSPALVRCLHTRGSVAAVRSGYMVTTRPSKTGWTVWALPLWHEVRKTCVAKRDHTRGVRSDPIDPRHIPMPPRPSGACRDQSMWMWEYELGKEVCAIAIQPEENLVAVAVAPVTVHYASGPDKQKAESFRLGRRHRIHFFKLRPPGLGMSYATEHGRPVRHPEAPRPFVDFIEPITRQNISDSVQYTLKAGPDGVVALLVRPQSRNCLTSSPLVIWDWRQGDCVGVVHAIPEVGQVLDFDFLTSQHIVLLEVERSADRYQARRNLNLPLAPHRCRLSTVQFADIIPRNIDVVYHSSAQPPSETFHHFLAKNCWTLDDCPEDSVDYVVSLELPPLLNRTLPRPNVSSLVFGSLSIFPPLSDDFPQSQVSFTVGCKDLPPGVFEAPNPVIRGAIAGAVIAGLVPAALKRRAMKNALARWAKVINTYPQSKLKVTDRLLYNLDRIVERQLGQSVSRPIFVEDDFDVALQGCLRLSHGTKLFKNLISAADGADIATASKLETKGSLSQALGGPQGVEENARIFSELLQPLASDRATLPSTEFRYWVQYADIEVLPSAPVICAHGCRVVYTDMAADRTPLGSPPGSDKIKADGMSSFHLVLRNYSLSLACFPRHYGMDAARWYSTSQCRNPSPSRKHESIPLAHPARYAKCSCPSGPGASPRPAGEVHAPWLVDEVLGTSQWTSRQISDPALPNGTSTDQPYCEARVAVAGVKGGLQGVYFDGQTVVLAQAERVTLLCF